MLQTERKTRGKSGVITNPHRWMCWELDVSRLAAFGCFSHLVRTHVQCKLVGPQPNMLPVSAPISTITTGFSATVSVKGQFPQHIFATGKPTKVRSYRTDNPITYWYLTCPRCAKDCRKLFWPAQRNRGLGRVWACRQCHRVIYPRLTREGCIPTRGDFNALGCEPSWEAGLFIDRLAIINVDRFMQRRIKRYGPFERRRGRPIGS
jgi:hypothetical protein